MSSREYLEAHGVQEAIAKAVSDVLKDQHANPVEAIADSLKPPGPPAVCSYLETIGNTPMVNLDRCVPEASEQATILCKLEMQNPRAASGEANARPSQPGSIPCTQCGQRRPAPGACIRGIAERARQRPRWGLYQLHDPRMINYGKIISELRTTHVLRACQGFKGAPWW